MAIKMPHIPKNHFAGEERGKTQSKTKNACFLEKNLTKIKKNDKTQDIS